MKFSIITINYNNREGLRRTIESVVNQTCRDFEYIIIDGGSTDGSVDVIKQYADQIDYWVSEPDKGIYNAMNKGVAVAKGEYLNFMNSGDAFYDRYRLDKVNRQNSNADIIVGKDFHVSDEGKYLCKSVLPYRFGLFRLYTSTFPHQSAFIKKTLFETNGYNESLKIVSDWEFYLRSVIFQGCTVEKFDDVVALCEVRGACSDSKAILEEREEVLCNYFPIGMRKEYDTIKIIGESAYNDFMFICQHAIPRRVCKLLLRAIVKIYLLFSKNSIQ